MAKIKKELTNAEMFAEYWDSCLKSDKAIELAHGYDANGEARKFYKQIAWDAFYEFCMRKGINADEII